MFLTLKNIIISNQSLITAKVLSDFDVKVTIVSESGSPGITDNPIWRLTLVHKKTIIKKINSRRDNFKLKFVFHLSRINFI